MYKQRQYFFDYLSSRDILKLMKWPNNQTIHFNSLLFIPSDYYHDHNISTLFSQNA